jgi:hypothetical protein
VCVCIPSLTCCVLYACRGVILCDKLCRQKYCPQCRNTKVFKRRGSICSECWNFNYAQKNKCNTQQQSLSTLETIGNNAVSLVRSLPNHSHYRAPLLHHLTQGITSTEAATTFNSSASYIRQCKRKEQKDSDLLNQTYSHDVKRQKLNDDSINHVMNYLIESCPTKSGSPRLEYRQYINDNELYHGYLQSKKEGMNIVCLNTFMKYKKWLRVKKVKSYWGQFDCVKCLALQRLKPKSMKMTHEDQLNNLRLRQPKGTLRDLLYHRVLYFPNSINIKQVELISNVDNC